MLHQSEAAMRRVAVATGGAAGILVKQLFEHEFNNGNFTAAEDVLEIGMLPADNQVCAVTVIGENLGAITASLGLMTGEFGNNLMAGRDAGAELGANINVNNAVTPLPLKDCLALPRQDTNRGLGLKLSGDVAAGAGKKIKILIEYFA